VAAGVGADPSVGGGRSTVVHRGSRCTHYESSQAAEAQCSCTGG